MESFNREEGKADWTLEMEQLQQRNKAHKKQGKLVSKATVMVKDR